MSYLLSVPCYSTRVSWAEREGRVVGRERRGRATRVERGGGGSTRKGVGWSCLTLRLFCQR